MILVTGANGMVGSYCKSVFGDCRLTDLPVLDVTDYWSIRNGFRQASDTIDFVLHLAAKTDVDACERDPDDAYRINTLGTLNVAISCQLFDIPMIYVSTGAVFHGDKPEPYTEFDTPNPISVYGKSKLEGEKIVQSLLKKYFIVRASWMMGGGIKDHKFVANIIRFCETKPEIGAVADCYGSPTYARHLLWNIKRLIATPYYGIYHMANGGMCNRFELACEIVKNLGKEVKVNSLLAAQFPASAPRGRSEALRDYKLDLLGLNMMPDWKDALKQYMFELKGTL